jgi:hypothetical protein
MTRKEKMRRHLLEYSDCRMNLGSLELNMHGLRNSIALKIWFSDFMIPVVLVWLWVVDAILQPIGLIEDFISHQLL